jgi:hypothetical protein
LLNNFNQTQIMITFDISKNNVILHWILSHVLDRHYGFVTLKDFELPDDGFDWGAETCWSDQTIIN